MRAQEKHPDGSGKKLMTCDVLGTPLCLTTYADFREHCFSLAQRPGTTAVDFSNTQIVTMRRHEPAFRDLTGCIDCFIPDSMPLTWCLNARGAKLSDRVYGPTFMREFLQTDRPSHTHYFLGGSRECVLQLKARALSKNPSLKILGLHDGYFKTDQEPALLEEINRLSPDFIWVGLGTPKQQSWIHRNRSLIPRGVIFAVGFAFDVNAGTKHDAPLWMQQLGLTWLFRLASEPRRLGPRYLRYNTLFLFYLLWDGLWRKATGPMPPRE